MHTNTAQLERSDASASVTPAVAELSAREWERDTAALALPHNEIHVVARFGPSAREGLDAHAMGARQRVHRKSLRGGQRVVSARLRLATAAAALGVPASAMSGRIVALEELWTAAAVRRLYARLLEAPDISAAAAVLESAIGERLANVAPRTPSLQLALAAARRLTSATVSSVAAELGVSERHLRRAFRENIGVSPKEFARVMRFHRALRAARSGAEGSWARIAAVAGYYDQAHLIADFRAIAGVTPRVLLGELRTASSL